MPKEDLIGRKFGKWTVLDRKKGNFKWRCACSCGTIRFVTGPDLKNGKSSQCRECYFKQRKIRKVYDHPLYFIWMGMIARCEKKASKNYHRYGGKGIKVCNRWHSFDLFVEDMGARPSKKHSIDRIDNDKGYSPENCRWATKKEQARNRTNNRLISYLGITMTMIEWAEKLCVSRHTLGNFLIRNSFNKAYRYYSNKKKKTTTGNIYFNLKQWVRN